MAVYNIIYGNTADCYVDGVSTTSYSAARLLTTAVSDTTSTVIGVTFTFSSPTYTIRQAFLQFDLSGVPSGAGSGSLSLNATTTGGTGIHTMEIAECSSISNKIAGASLPAPVGSCIFPTAIGRFGPSIADTSTLTRSATFKLVCFTQSDRLNVAPTDNNSVVFNSADQTGTTSDPFLTILVGNPWAFLGVSNEVAVATTAHALVTTGISGTLQAGDLLVACITSRIASTTSVTLPTGGEWTLVSEQKNNNTLTTSSALPSGLMAYCVRGASNPNLTFTHPVAPSQAQGRIVAYRNVNTASPKDTQTSFTTATAQTAVTGTGLTTTQIEDLIVAMACGGQEAAWSAFNATDPAGASGATVTTAPTTTWSERADSAVTTGADGSLAIFDAVKLTSGATGNLTATASVSAGHVVIAGAFKITARLADAWNVEDKSAAITLSASDKTATLASSTNSGVRSTTQKLDGAAGKFYAEFNLVDLGGGATLFVGIQPASQALNTTSGNIRFAAGTGDIIVNNATVGNIGIPSTSDIICIAWDSGAELVWIRRNNGNWNNSGSADPATGAGSFDASFVTAANQALWFYGGTSGQSVTLRTESAEFSYYGPVGFTSWMGEALPAAPAGDGVGTAAGVGAASAQGAAFALAAGTGTATGATSATGSTLALAAGTGTATGATSAVGQSIVIAAGDGAAAGTGAASATGALIGTGAGTAAGIGAAAATGAPIAAGAGTAAGVGAASPAGVTIGIGAGTAAGIGAASATGSTTSVVASGDGTSAGTGAASATGAAVLPAAGTAAGSSTATGTGRATAAVTGTATGTGAAGATGAGTAAGTGNAPATGAANATGRLTGAGIGSAAGIGAAAATATVTAASAGTAAGLGAAISLSDPGTTTGTATSVGTANAAGVRITATVATAAGTGAAAATGALIGAGAGSATGIGAGVATGRGVASAAGSAAGIGTAAATAEGGLTVSAVGSAAGTGAANAVSLRILAAVGSAAGTSAASATGRATGTAAGSAAGVGTASAVGAATGTAIGSAAGTGGGTGYGVGVVTQSTVGTAAATGSAAGVGFSIRPSATAPERIIVTAAEFRLITAAVERRTITTAVENRTIVAVAEDRTIAAELEDREIETSEGSRLLEAA